MGNNLPQTQIQRGTRISLKGCSFSIVFSRTNYFDGGKMITIGTKTAVDWLWGITLANLSLGTLLWLWNSLALAIDDFDWSGDAANAVVWQSIGSSLWGFGVLVFVITLATSAIVGSLQHSPAGPVMPNFGGPLEQPDSYSVKGKKKSLGEWLDEDRK